MKLSAYIKQLQQLENAYPEAIVVECLNIEENSYRSLSRNPIPVCFDHSRHCLIENMPDNAVCVNP